MASGTTCPSRDVLCQLMLGRLDTPDADELVQHLKECDVCVSSIQTLHAEDTLIEAARRRPQLEMESEPDVVKLLIERLSHLGQHVLARVVAETLKPDVVGRPWANDAVQLHEDEETSDKTYSFLAPKQASDEIGRLGHYRVLREIGAGGMGIVFQAEDVQLKRMVALKVINPKAAAHAGAHERFVREARAMAALEHDNIVTVHQVGEEEGVPFLAMPWLKGM